MEYFLGVDGGASSTISAVCTADGAVLGIGRGGPSNHILAPGGRERARRALAMALGEAMSSARLASVEFRAAELGMTGINPGTPESHALEEVVREMLSARAVRVDNDANVALAGAFACGPGSWSSRGPDPWRSAGTERGPRPERADGATSSPTKEADSRWAARPFARPFMPWTAAVRRRFSSIGFHP